jgi:hypothetical protein
MPHCRLCSLLLAVSPAVFNENNYKTEKTLVMKLIIKLYYAVAIIAVSLTGGCKKIITVDPPSTRLVTSVVFNNNSTATAAQLAIYAQMQGDFWDLHSITGLSADELTNYSTDQTVKDLYTNSLTAISDGTAIAQWATAYKRIYQENAVLEGLSVSIGVSNRVKQQLSGEAYFIRAYFYFWLANLYGEVPLVTTTDYTKNIALAREKLPVVYQFIIQDLVHAKNLLSNIYVDATDTVSTPDRVRPTVWSANALLARVYLYTNKYDSAELESSKVINNTTLFKLPTDLTQVFLKTSTEAILQNIPGSSFKYTSEGQSFSFITVPPGPSSNTKTLSNAVFNAFEIGDKRKIAWVKSYTVNGNSWNIPYKYRDNGTTTIQTEYSMVLRLAEQYLIRAEAKAKQDNLNGAIDDINQLRLRAGLLPLPYTLTKNQILVAIAHERQTELFIEGDRWIDLKRTSAIDSVMTTATPLKGGLQWKSFQQLYPVSITEIQSDPFLTQTPGY